MAKARDQQRALLFACTAGILLSCRKDGDSTPPLVTIIAPVDGAMLQVPQSFLVRVQVQDDHLVESVGFTLLNADHLAIASDGGQVGEPSALVERYLSVEDERWPSGPVTLIVRASDGTTETRAYVHMQLTAAPLRLKAVFAIGGSGPLQVQRIDSTYQVTQWTFLAQDFGGMALSSNDQRLVIAGSVSGPITSVDVNTAGVAWQIANTNNDPQSWITALDHPRNGPMLTSFRSGAITGYHAATGSVAFTTYAMPDHESRRATIIEDQLISDQIDPNAGTRRLVRYQASSGALIGSTGSDLTVRYFSSLGDGWMLLFGNRSGDGVVQAHRLDLSANWEPRVFPGEPVVDAVGTSTGVVVMALPDRLVRYTYADNGAVTIATGIAASSICYDAANGELLALDGQTIVRLDPTTGTTLGGISLLGSANHIGALFNREP
ncbi:MAG: hypothetical protein H6595_09335 [Flavobacteriales bacterium]|nr:hypothetical protein [Flavobacteriales bacterium]MCB9167666.1 hypothetical protein [Flavobacteriales bacterium]